MDYNNAYATPETDLELEYEDELDAPMFYIVSNKKFLTLFFATIGAYTIYWFYRNWKGYKEATGESMWPVARAIFSIFFAHSLFNEVDSRLRKRSSSFSWNPSGMATLFVVMAIIERVSDKLSAKGIGTPATDVIGLITLPLSGFALLQAQKAVNAAHGDPDGTRNSQFSAANIILILLGGLLWLTIIVGLFAESAGII